MNFWKRIFGRKEPEESYELETEESIESELQKKEGSISLKLPGDISLELVEVKGGAFMMGSEDSGEADLDEQPVHRVTVDSFWMGIFPVTQAQWKAIMGENPSSFQGEQHPVESVSWKDCKRFFNKLNASVADRGIRFRLPTEAEWEYAAKGGNQSKGCKYAGSDMIDDVAWYDENSGDRTHAVGQKKPNELGLYDMSGNVWEWCEDDWHENYTGAPTDGSAWVDSPRGSHRVHRGGSWIISAWYCRSANRLAYSPSLRSYCFGVRALAVRQ